MTERNAALVRTLTVLRLLEGRKRWTLYVLAERFHVHPRTIRRDLYALADAGYPIAHEERGEMEGRTGAWWLEAAERRIP